MSAHVWSGFPSSPPFVTGRWSGVKLLLDLKLFLLTILVSDQQHGQNTIQLLNCLSAYQFVFILLFQSHYQAATRVIDICWSMHNSIVSTQPLPMLVQPVLYTFQTWTESVNDMATTEEACPMRKFIEVKSALPERQMNTVLLVVEDDRWVLARRLYPAQPCLLASAALKLSGSSYPHSFFPEVRKKIVHNC